jgi:hypothetical protein
MMSTHTTSRREPQVLALTLSPSISRMDNANMGRETLKGTAGGSPRRLRRSAKSDPTRERDFRRIALGMEGAVEGAHMGHPDFRVNNRIFAALHHDRAFGGLALTSIQQARLLSEHPNAFEPASGAWGRAGATTVRLASVAEEALGEAMTLAWQNTVAKGPPGSAHK